MNTRELINLEIIRDRAYEELCDCVGIEPYIERTPGRDYDPDGNLSSWYETKYYPIYTKSKQNKLIKCLMKTEEGEALIARAVRMLVETEKLSKDEIKEILEKA